MTNPYLSVPRIKAALRSLELRPARGMGQNFLIDSAVLDAILAAAEVTPNDTTLEIGPGLGVLTWELLQRAGEVIAVELDRRLIDRLHQEFADQPTLTLIQGDILTLPPASLLAQGTRSGTRPYKVVANLPYAITSPALRHMLEASSPPTSMVVLVQWEVAQRIAARAGDLSVLAHAVQLYAEPDVVARVPSKSFFPAPAVDSAILRLRVRPHLAVDVESVDALMRVIKAGFLQGRKKLSNALPGGLAAMGRPIAKEDAILALHAAHVNPDRRAETVTLAEWALIYRALQTYGGDPGQSQ